METLGLNREFWLDRPTYVTGGTGLVGFWLAKRLIEAGADVVCLVRDWIPQSEMVRERWVEDGAAAYMLLAEALEKMPELKGEAFNLSNEIQVTVSEVVSQISKLMQSNLETDIRNEVTNEIRHQYLSARNWHPLFTREDGLQKAIAWYEDFFEHERKS